MRSYKRISLSVCVLLGFSSWAVAQEPCPSGGVTCLDQGWGESQRQQFYTTTQGSQLMPLAWFLALERPGSEELFGGDGLSRFGFLPSPKSTMNPDGLPVGFAEDPTNGGWIGLTCSACHTGQIEYHGTAVRIDGGPAITDVFAFVTELNAALQATFADPMKFSRFAAKAAGSDVRRQHDLRNELTRFAAYFSTFLDASTPDSPWGPARVDAFGMIFNRVSAIDLSQTAVWSWFQPLEENSQKPNAPVSYPSLWGTSRYDRVQWNAVAKNKLKYERLGRNIAEALGVFARINLRKPNDLSHGYTSTVNVNNQLMIEESLVRTLKSPQWPSSILVEIDEAKSDKGKALYGKYCVSCHKVIDRSDDSLMTVKQVPIGDAGTDPTMATNVACRMVDTGTLAGVRQPPIILLGHRLEQKDYVMSVASNAGIGVLEEWLASQGKAANPQTPATLPKAAAKAPTPGQAPQVAKPTTTLSGELQRIPNPFEAAVGTLGDCKGAAKVYRAAPLGGVWATAPYLHNGSVANLYQLLLPGEERLQRFKVGSREFDPMNVGFDLAGGTFEFDTTVEGNSNKGHEYGTKKLTDEERWQLVEYLKTL